MAIVHYRTMFVVSRCYTGLPEMLKVAVIVAIIAQKSWW